MRGVHPETLLAGGYALFLVAVAFGLDVLARHSHGRSERYRTAGFRYHRHLDAWECPQGEYLPLVEIDRQRRVARYQGRAAVCNPCPLKESCTDSDDGREIRRGLDSWPHSEAGRFHRAISLVLVTLAGLMIVVGAALNPVAADLILLGVILAVTCAAAARLGAELAASP